MRDGRKIAHRRSFTLVRRTLIILRKKLEHPRSIRADLRRYRRKHNRHARAKWTGWRSRIPCTFRRRRDNTPAPGRRRCRRFIRSPPATQITSTSVITLPTLNRQEPARISTEVIPAAREKDPSMPASKLAASLAIPEKSPGADFLIRSICNDWEIRFV